VNLVGPFALAFVAGLISFTSPCCLPLMPGYVSYVGGVSGASAGTIVRTRTRVLFAAALFVAGFVAVFTVLGAGASLLGAWVLRNRAILTQVAGVFVVVMGLATMGILRIPLLYREARFELHRLRPGPAGAFPLGAAFAVGWAPCIGPVLGSILTAAATTQSLVRGASLLFVYSLGLGVPFLLLAYGYTGASRPFDWLRRRSRGIEIAGGAVLITMGVLMITGQWTRLFTPVLRLFSRAGWPPI